MRRATPGWIREGIVVVTGHVTCVRDLGEGGRRCDLDELACDVDTEHVALGAADEQARRIAGTRAVR
jgi:hypothetical protein